MNLTSGPRTAVCAKGAEAVGSGVLCVCAVEIACVEGIGAVGTLDTVAGVAIGVSSTVGYAACLLAWLGVTCLRVDLVASLGVGVLPLGL